jgi:hypothetical protein
MSLLSWFLEIIFVAVCYSWWTFCCFWIPPKRMADSGVSESVEQYMQRIMLPRYFVNFYFLPLLSGVATCTHKDLLQFPASDLTEYKRQSTGGKHYTATALGEVEKTLGSGIESRFSATVTKVEELHNERLKLAYETSDGASHEDYFDHIVLAVAPDVAGRIFQPLRKAMAQIPTTMVQNLVQGNGFKLAASGIKPTELKLKEEKAAQTVHLRTSLSMGRTESIQVHHSGATITTCPLSDISSAQNVLTSVQFLRALRTPHSRRVVNDIFGGNTINPLRDVKQPSWRNGDDSVWLVGGWCWDGMILLEGCVVSAVRVATALGVEIPWDARKT